MYMYISANDQGTSRTLIGRICLLCLQNMKDCKLQEQNGMSASQSNAQLRGEQRNRSPDSPGQCYEMSTQSISLPDIYVSSSQILHLNLKLQEVTLEWRKRHRSLEAPLLLRSTIHARRMHHRLTHFQPAARGPMLSKARSSATAAENAKKRTECCPC